MGSEMCIRDRSHSGKLGTEAVIAQSAILGDLDCIGKIEQNKNSAIDEQHQLKQ